MDNNYINSNLASTNAMHHACEQQATPSSSVKDNMLWKNVCQRAFPFLQGISPDEEKGLWKEAQKDKLMQEKKYTYNPIPNTANLFYEYTYTMNEYNALNEEINQLNNMADKAPSSSSKEEISWKLIYSYAHSHFTQKELSALKGDQQIFVQAPIRYREEANSTPLYSLKINPKIKEDDLKKIICQLLNFKKEEAKNLNLLNMYPINGIKRIGVKIIK